MTPLGDRERVAELGRAHLLLGKREHDLAVSLEQPARVHDGEADQAAVRAKRV